MKLPLQGLLMRNNKSRLIKISSRACYELCARSNQRHSTGQHEHGKDHEVQSTQHIWQSLVITRTTSEPGQPAESCAPPPQRLGSSTKPFFACASFTTSKAMPFCAAAALALCPVCPCAAAIDLVDLVGNLIELLMAVDRQIRAFWQVLAHQSISALIGAALSGAVRVADCCSPFPRALIAG